MECFFCPADGPDVEVVADPFAADVNNEEWLIPLCDDCYGSRAREV
ncbi:hypothetical protein [Kitasatospora sp. NPDC088134]